MEESADFTVLVPAALCFSDLALELDDAGGLHLLPAPLIALADANGINIDVTDEDAVCELIGEWYIAHIEQAGDSDTGIEAVLNRLRTRHRSA